MAEGLIGTGTVGMMDEAQRQMEGARRQLEGGTGRPPTIGIRMPGPGEVAIETILMPAHPHAADPMGSVNLLGLKVGISIPFEAGEDREAAVREALKGLDERLFRAAMAATEVRPLPGFPGVAW